MNVVLSMVAVLMLGACRAPAQLPSVPPERHYRAKFPAIVQDRDRARLDAELYRLQMDLRELQIRTQPPVKGVQ